MIIKNKKTGKFESITQENWVKLQLLGFKRKFEVIDATDVEGPMDIQIPQEVKDFMASLGEPLTRKEMSEIKAGHELLSEEDILEDELITEPEQMHEVHDDEGTAKRVQKRKSKSIKS